MPPHLVPPWLRELLRKLKPAPLKQVQAAMLAGAFAMGAATVAGLNAAQQRAQSQAEAGDGQQAIETLATANAEARATLHAGLRAEESRLRRELGARLDEVNGQLEKRALSGDEAVRRAEALIARHSEARAEVLEAYLRTFRHERLQLQAIEWSPEQQPLVDRRLAELREAEGQVVERFLGREADTAFDVEAAPGEVELPPNPVADELPKLGLANRLSSAANPDTVATHQADTVSTKTAQAPLLAVVEDGELFADDEDLVEVGGPLGD